jgi:hypothetical protein
LWFYTKRKELIIDYVNSCGESTARFSVAGSACEKLTSEEIDIKEYINLVEFNVKT